ncbi:hypothetical protein BDL97_18G024200 [Sphagnum fallax]|nr:hypothetical protein BDL97_18G024200 [Sphagnum fallax]
MAVSFFSTTSFHSLLFHISKQSIFSLSDPRLSTISYLCFSQAASCSTSSTTRSSSSSRFRTHTFFSTGVQVQRKHEFAHGAVAAVAMAGGMDVSHSGGEETGGMMGRCSHRPEMLSKVAYIPPSWASHLQVVPSHFFSLGQFPTPIHQWHLPGLPDGTEVYVKRDDLTGMQLSGNKVRKLEFLLADAKEQGADCVITIGGIQSNHCRATAVAARYIGLDSYLILRTNRTEVEDDPGLTGNLLVERMVGAHVSLVSKEEYVKYGSVMLGNLLADKLKSQGRKPYVIPVGGSDSLGTWGYIEFVRELKTQLQEGRTSGVTHFDDIVMACGSGGTTAGLSLAAHLSKLDAQVHAYAVCDSEEYFYDYTQGLIDGLIGGVSSREIVRIVNAKGLGYAMSTSAELNLVKDVAESTGIILDPVYSGKALNGMLKDMAENPTKWEGKKVLFVHTGGLLGMYEKVVQLQPLLGKWERLRIPEFAMQPDDTKG